MLRLPGLIVLLSVACSTDPLSTLQADLQITPITATVRAGDSLGIILANRSSIRLVENLCAFNLLRDSASTWVLAASEPAGVRPAQITRAPFRQAGFLGTLLRFPGRCHQDVIAWFSPGSGQAGLTLPEEMRASGPFYIQ